MLNQIYDTLLYINPDGTEDPQPRIAESYEISDDGLDYTFHLRQGLTFQDGTPITADDVVFSIELYGVRVSGVPDFHALQCRSYR